MIRRTALEGLLTEIERFALNDGPGIRTTVFFKGCNMNCRWCHNPETIKPGCDILYYASKCIGCCKCVYACPSKAQDKIGNAHVFYPNICVKCGKCADICYAGAMTMCGKKYTVDDVMKEVVQDKSYYASSGGGVTLSGGEVLCQREFALALTDACHKEGISVGVETNLNFPWNSVKDVLDAVNLIMCDVKLIDDEEHKKQTGVGNTAILNNVRRVAGSGKPFIVRTPLVPGVTDTNENIAGIAAFLKEADKNGTMMYYELLNFNPLGATKYEALARQNDFKDAKPLPKARVHELAAVAQSAGIKVRTE